MTDEQLTALRRRRQIQIGSVVVVTLLASIILADHLGWFGYHGDDWIAFDGKRMTISKMDDAGHLMIRKDGRDIQLSLIGISPPDSKILSQYKDYLRDQVLGKTVIIKLEPLETRSKDYLLRCYVYLNEEDCLNINLLHDGLVATDKDANHSLKSLAKGAEADAKKRGRGIWKKG